MVKILKVIDINGLLKMHYFLKQKITKRFFSTELQIYVFYSKLILKTNPKWCKKCLVWNKLKKALYTVEKGTFAPLYCIYINDFRVFS